MRIECVQGDITSQPDVDAVVNAANAHLAPGGGVAGAIHSAAGPGLYEECKPLAPIATGDAVITSGHALPNEWCIHVLGPVYSSSRDPAGDLTRCYVSMLARADERGLGSIATPAISTGIFGYPIGEAAVVSLEAVQSQQEHLESVRLVRFVLWSDRDFGVYREALERMHR